MPFEIVRNDITRMRTDAIVNAANEALQMGSGVCGAIFRAAGAQQLQEACNAIGGCKTGQSVLTGGFALPARCIIHTVGPVWHGGAQHEEALLRACYRSALALAKETGCSSIAFPLISSGVYGYPKDAALQVAVSEIKAFLLEDDSDMDVRLVVFDRQAFDLGQSRFAAVKSYVSAHYVEERMSAEVQRYRGESVPVCAAPSPLPCDNSYRDTLTGMELYEAAPPFLRQPAQHGLAERLNRLDETFSEMLLRLIDEKACTDVEIYKRANIDRKLFSKIRSNKEYKPSKQTALALAVSLRLSLDETKDLLLRAGFALSHSNRFDVIVEYHLSEGIWDIYEINAALFAFGQMLLGGAAK